MSNVTRVIAVSAAVTTPPSAVENVIYMLSRDLGVKPPFWLVGTSLMELETGYTYTGPDTASVWMHGVEHLDRFKPLLKIPHHIALVRMKEDGSMPLTVFADAEAVTVPTEIPTEDRPQRFEFTFGSLMMADGFQ